jgi:hypothetical protein
VSFCPVITSNITVYIDSHAHMLEYGASRLIPLESARSAKGDPGPSQWPSLNLTHQSRDCIGSPVHSIRRGYKTRSLEICRGLGLGPHKVGRAGVPNCSKAVLLLCGHMTKSPI